MLESNWRLCPAAIRFAAIECKWSSHLARMKKSVWKSDQKSICPVLRLAVCSAIPTILLSAYHFAMWAHFKRVWHLDILASPLLLTLEHWTPETLQPRVTCIMLLLEGVSTRAGDGGFILIHKHQSAFTAQALHKLLGRSCSPAKQHSPSS